ncbi:MAG: hypothetical protein ACR2I8_01670 [Steroidobacteraceae bacterium]
MIDPAIAARALHVLGVVLWIGGVAFVTTVLLPSVRRQRRAEERLELFEAIEGRFAWQARATTLLVGASGFFLVEHWDLWPRFAHASWWWMHAMVAVWALFTLMLFVLEPLFLHRWFRARAALAPEQTYRRIERMHWLLLTVSLVTVLGAVAGSHGWIP